MYTVGIITSSDKGYVGEREKKIKVVQSLKKLLKHKDLK